MIELTQACLRLVHELRTPYGLSVAGECHCNTKSRIKKWFRPENSLYLKNRTLVLDVENFPSEITGQIWGYHRISIPLKASQIS